MTKDYGSMTADELRAELGRLKDRLEDMEEALRFHYMNTSAHVPGRHVKKDGEELEELRAEIARLEGMTA